LTPAFRLDRTASTLWVIDGRKNKSKHKKHINQ
jgi:hypothetical protein